MSSRLPPQSVTPPVKKRGRFSHPSPPVHDFTPPNPANFSLSIHRRQIPGGFAYDELDEDDSEEDPDFEADLTSFPDHIQQPPRPLLPPLRTPPQTRLDRPAAAKRPRLDVSRQHAASLNGPSASVSAPFHPEAVCPGEEDPEFEVDDLDSTDDEPDELPSTWMGEHQSLQYPPVLRLGDDSIQLDSEDDEDDPDYQVGNVDISPSNLQNAPHDTLRNQPQQPLVLRLGDDNLNFDSENEEDDPDYQIGNVDSQPITSQEPLDGTPDDPLDDTPDDTPDDPLDDAQESQESPDNDYIRFLMGLLADNGSPSNTAAPANLENAAEGNAQNEASQNAPNTMLDDDDDFDYLRESALVQDDPLEFREDLPVSRKEVAQLIFSSEEPNLRRQTRTWKSRKAAPRRHLVPICRDSSAAVAPTPLLPALPHAGVLPAAVPVNLAPCVAPTQVHPVPYAVQPYGNSPQTFCEISTPHVLQIKEQLGVYTHLLTHIHADLRKKARVEEKNRTSEKNGSGDDAAMQARKEGGSDAVVASAKTEELLRRLVENKKISSSYHDMLNSNIGKLKPFSEKMLYRDRDVWFKYESCKVSMYDLPCIDLIEGFLRDCEILSADKLPGEAMKRFEGYKRMDVGQALQRKQQQRQFTLVRAQKGWFAWSVEDDTLLAMTIGKYGRDFGSGWKDLLPHRVGDDCRARVRYLASRRCGDNAVKRQVMHVSTRLTKEELKLVQIGLMRFGGNVEDGEMWKCIQRDFLPNREWSHLQKLWLWRETRRKYKVKYRAKAVEKKKAALLRGGATQA